MARQLEQVINASALWIQAYESRLRTTDDPYAPKTFEVREHAHRFAGLDDRETIEHSLRLARTVRSKAEELAAKPGPHPMDMHMIRVMACRLCKLNRQHPCDADAKNGADCELGIY